MEGGPPLAKPSSSYKTTLYSWDGGVGGLGRGGGTQPELPSTGVVGIGISFCLWYC